MSVVPAAPPRPLAPLSGLLARPPAAFGPMPFWFWNDDLQRDELLRQLRCFAAAGCGGVVPHARVGLSRRVGYLTDTFLELMRDVVEEAARLGLKVILYDEASYPSGSARGAVAAANPEHVSRAIGLWTHDVRGPARGFWRPNTGRALRDRHVVTVAAPACGPQAVDPADLRVLEPAAHDVLGYDLPAGDWRLLSVWQTDSGGHIRGAFADEESGSATAPAAGDILNPEAVASFVHLTHERYRQAVGDHFGNTVVAMFTDEPGVFGKGPRRPTDPRPYTPGFVDWLERLWDQDPRPWLPALWMDYGPGTDVFRARYRRAVQTRLHEVFYAAQRRWCGAHGLALTGHPGASNDMASLRAFHLPGQDMVWRYIEPGTGSALEGAHSVAAKAATSGARRAGARRALTEVCGAYGWRLSLDEVKWLFDWHLVRGNNLINPHAFFYSIRGRRAWESEPDLGLHNVWWPHVGHLLRYAGRLSWLLADAEPVCDIAVLGDAADLPWHAAARLLTGQRDFTYVDAAAVAAGRVRGGRLRIGGAGYRAVVVDGEPDIDASCQQRLDELAAAGGLVVEAAAPEAAWQALPRSLSATPAQPDLRVAHVRKAGLDAFLLVNEGECRLQADLELPVAGLVEAWDPLRDRRWLPPAQPGGAPDTTALAVDLERRESLVLAVDPAGHAPGGQPAPDRADDEDDECLELTHWSARRLDDGDDTGAGDGLTGLGDWSRIPGWELFSGTVEYCTRLHLPDDTLAAELDLGAVGELAECRVDGEPVGVALWGPYRLVLRGPPQGPIELAVRVTNSMANRYEGAQRPSGLLGPVRLHLRRRSRQSHPSHPESEAETTP